MASKLIYCYWISLYKAVSHQHLLLKLSHYGINGLLFNWIKDYLSNRKQQAILDGSVSMCYVESTSELCAGTLTLSTYFTLMI